MVRTKENINRVREKNSLALVALIDVELIWRATQVTLNEN
jgi:hypothetical protein